MSGPRRHAVRGRVPLAIGSLCALVLMAASCGANGCARAPTMSSPCDRPSAPYSVVDDLYASRIDDVPLLLRADIHLHLDAPEVKTLLAALRVVSSSDLSSLDGRVRVVVQNDVWGAWQRVSASEDAHPARALLAESASSAVRALAIEGPDVAPNALPVSIVQHLPLADGWREREIEVPSTQHERLFGLRRLFRVVEREPDARGFGGVVPPIERALFSTLVAVDAQLVPRRTNVVGDLEMLRFDGDRLVGARLFELVRERLACGEVALVETGVATRVPGLGANGHLAEFDVPVPLAELPCATCHDTSEPMSLPSSTLPVGERHGALLAGVRREIDLMVVELKK